MAGYPIVLGQEAEADLAELTAYLAREAGGRIAERQLGRIFEKLHLLAEFPRIGHARSEIVSPRRAFVVAPWVVLYDPLPDGGIAVWRIVHGRRDLTAIAPVRR